MESNDLDDPMNLELELLSALDGEEEVKESPENLVLLPLLKRPFFPGMATPILVEPGSYFELLKIIAKSKNKCVGLILTKTEDADIYTISYDDLNTVGVMARILRVIPIEQGGAQVILNIEKRFRVDTFSDDPEILQAKVIYEEEKPEFNQELKAYAISIISTIKELLHLNPLFKEELQIFLGHSDFTEPGQLADFAAALTTATREELQDILCTFNVEKRIDKVLILLRKELDLSKLQSNINQKIEATITKSQRDYFLKEQLKTIRKELGFEKDDKALDKAKFMKRIEERKVPEVIMKTINEEMEKLSVLDVQSAEYGVARGYLDWLTVLPWGLYSEDQQDLQEAKTILEEDHHGLEDTKKRILEFIGVGILSGGIKGGIICLAGPPGVGKTSIGKSIARALNRKFYRFSVGGMRDEAEIKGHRRTYIGAMPGKLIQALKTTQTMNPVIMLDEVDKMGNSFQGDPASALLEVLDQEQNSDFLDHYLDVRCDLSNILFIVTANVLDTIPEPLKDRMDILRLSGYIMEEKVEIAKRFLIPRHRKDMGLKASQISFTDLGLKAIIQGHARESGVRTLENKIKKILRKVAVGIVEKQSEEKETRGKKKRKKKPVPMKKCSITAKSLNEYLGNPIYTSDRFYEHTPVGVATGLAWTALGGATLYVEAIKVPGEKTEMKLTGQAGDVMKESAAIAWSYLHGAIRHYAPEYTFFEKNQVHIHIPEGATPKDGPSAGVTMVTALLSLILDRPIDPNLGMTGELTLTGRVLMIGGVKEKLVASRRSGLNRLIFPKDNKRDVDELQDYITDGLEIHFVEHYDQVFDLIFK
jgi:ATP-dependent Lon protease